MRIEYGSLSDYPYAYLDLLRTVLKLNPASGNGFRAYEGEPSPSRPKIR